MYIEVIIDFEIEAIHQWKDCNITEVEFLKHKHRHLFKIRGGFGVEKEDRELEIFYLQAQIQNFLENKFPKYNNSNIIDLGNSSCETVAILILQNFAKANWVEVLEDGKGGAKVCR